MKATLTFLAVNAEAAKNAEKISNLLGQPQNSTGGIFKDANGHPIMDGGDPLKDTFMPRDAIQHLYWTAKMVMTDGEAAARLANREHETGISNGTRWAGLKNISDHNMDDFNNEVAIKIGLYAAQNGKSDAWLVGRIELAVSSGEVITHREQDLLNNRFGPNLFDYMSGGLGGGLVASARAAAMIIGQILAGLAAQAAGQGAAQGAQSLPLSNTLKQLMRMPGVSSLLTSSIFKGAVNSFGTALKLPGFPVDPVVLDLDDNGIETTSIEEGAFIQVDGSGFAQATGWVKNDGVLFNDLDGDNLLSNFNELVGASVTTEVMSGATGFNVLESMDLNGDGALNSNDPGFASMKILISGTGEVRSLAELGIVSLNLDASSVNTTDQNGNLLIEQASFTRANGTVGLMSDYACGIRSKVTPKTGTKWPPAPEERSRGSRAPRHMPGIYLKVS